jgi:hypothetical protein
VSLRYINRVAWTGLVALSAALFYALASGHFYADGRQLLENPWGLATVVDVYVGFALFCCWIAWREVRITSTITWIVLVLLGGNLVSAIYVLIALRSSRDSIEIFWHGSRRADFRCDQVLQSIQSRDESV